MSYPLISIIVPAYNHEKYIIQCLDSILKDNYPNKEIVIIDDGSTDNTKQVIEAWIQKHQNIIPSLFKSRPNKGITKTLNELIELSKGEYLVLIASDDYLLNNSITTRYNYLINNPDKKAVFGDCIVVDTDANLVYDSALNDLYHVNKKNYLNSKNLQDEFIIRWAVPGPVLLFKKDILKIIGKYDENLFVEDLDFYLRMAIHNLIGFIDEKVSAYRIHNTNTCKAEEHRQIFWANTKTVINKHFKDLHPHLKLFILWRFNIRPILVNIIRFFIKK